MIDLLTAGENRHSRITAEKNVRRNIFDMTPLFKWLDSGAEHQRGLRERRTSLKRGRGNNRRMWGGEQRNGEVLVPTKDGQRT
jgi:hypothetical protein